MLTQRFPYPANRGDRIRSYNLLRELSREFDVTLAALADEPISPSELQHVEAICDRVIVDRLGRGSRIWGAAKSVMRRKSISEGFFSSKLLSRQVVKIHRANPFDSVLVFCSSMFPYVDRPEFKDTKLVVDLVDVDSQKWDQLGRESRFPKSIVFAWESARVRSLEQRIVQSASSVTLVSSSEAKLLEEKLKIPNQQTLCSISNGVDTDYFESAASSGRGRVEARPLRLVFTGVMNYPPNVDGIDWFCRKVLPRLGAQIDVKLKIVGRFPNQRVQALGDLPGVEVVGAVPDVRPFLDDADVAISPLKLARGIQNKVLEAMDMGKPVVCSSQSAVGIDCEDGVHLLIADSVADWCSALNTLRHDSEFGDSLARNARSLVSKEYSWSAKITPMLDLLRPDLQAPIRVGFVMHKMQVAGAEVLVKQIIERLKPSIEATVFCLDGVGQLGHELIEAGIEVVDLKRKPGIDLKVARRLAAEVKSRDIEVIHAHQYTPFFYSALARMFHGVRAKTIFTEHGRHFPDVVSSKRRLANRFCLQRYAEVTTACCDFSTDALQKNEGFAEAFTLANGVDLRTLPARGNAVDLVRARKRLGLDPNTLYVACIARFHPVKDHATLIRAWNRVHRRLPHAKLLLVGDGPQRHNLERQIESLCVALPTLADSIMFLGIRDDVPEILRAVDVFTLTSVSEAASLTLLEAMASGCPSVVTDVGGNSEHIRLGIDGLLVPRADDQQLADSLVELLSDESIRQSFAASARQRVTEQFSLEKSVASYFQHYLRLAGRSEVDWDLLPDDFGAPGSSGVSENSIGTHAGKADYLSGNPPFENIQAVQN